MRHTRAVRIEIDEMRKATRDEDADIGLHSLESKKASESAKWLVEFFDDAAAQTAAGMEELLRTKKRATDSEFCGETGITEPSVSRVVLEAALLCLMPRTDEKVTTGLTHLLKAPMSVHPKTGKLAMRIESTDLLRFSPFGAPKIVRVEQKPEYAHRNWITPILVDTPTFDDEGAVAVLTKDFEQWADTLPRPFSKKAKCPKSDECPTKPNPCARQGAPCKGVVNGSARRPDSPKQGEGRALDVNKP